jgi:hypothetical protein
MAEVTLDTTNINDWDTFHAQSAKVFGFPGFYGKNHLCEVAAGDLPCTRRERGRGQPTLRRGWRHCSPTLGAAVTGKSVPVRFERSGAEALARQKVAQ